MKIFSGKALFFAVALLAFADCMTFAQTTDSASTDTDSVSGASLTHTAPDGAPPSGERPSGAPGEAPGGGSQTVDHGTYATKLASSVKGKTYASTGDTENAVRIEDGAKVALTGVTIDKTAGNAASGDASSFYGSNAALLALDGATVTVNDTTIRTSKNNSGGVMVTGGGTMYVNDCDIVTQGGSSAAIRSDRGGGTLVVKGGAYTSNGNGSPAIYCTAKITVSDATLTATTSEAIVVEGKNSVSLKNCDVSGKMIKDNVENIQNVMIYQSMSGDANVGTSSFSMEGGSLTSNAGDMFYVTNTHCTVSLTGVALKLSNEYLLKVVGNDARNGWGTVGKNGGQCEFTAVKQTLSGKIKVDSISKLTLSLTDGSSFTGAINADNEGGTVAVSLDSNSAWTLTGDSYVSALTGSTANVKMNGYKLYVGGKLVN